MKIRYKLILQRKNKNMTQIEVSKKLKVTERHYQKIEAGTSNGSIDFWLRAKDFFSTTIDELLEQDSSNEELFKLGRENSSSKN